MTDYLQPYREGLLEHGPSFEATLWASPRTQRRRFEAFAEAIPLAGKRLLDAGCGGGDLAAFLLERDIPYSHYLGLDAMPEMVEYARLRRLPRAEFRAADLLHDPHTMADAGAQIVLISGTLNTMSPQQAMTLLGHAWEAAGEALIFNFLSDRAGPLAASQTGPARRHDTLGLMSWALSHSPRVAFRQDYLEHGHDATITIRRP